jgi:prefoldin subunit 5
MAGFVGFIGGAVTVSDDSGELMRSLKDKIADIKSELEEMDDDAQRPLREAPRPR